MPVGQPVLDTNHKHLKNSINVNLDKNDDDNNDYNYSNHNSMEEKEENYRERESLLTFTNPSKTTCKSLFDLRPIFWDTRYFTPNQAESLYHGEPSCTHAFKYKMMLLLWRLSVMVTRGQCTTCQSPSL